MQPSFGEKLAPVDTALLTSVLVKRLVAAQFPQWADLPVSRLDVDGWDNSTFKLGTMMSVRLPNGDEYAAQTEKEQRWLPILGRELPLPIPEPLALGTPGLGFSYRWSIFRWIDGSTARNETVSDLTGFALDLAAFLSALQNCDSRGGPAAGPHSHERGGPVAVWDCQVHDALRRLQGEIDVDGAVDVWEAALATNWQALPVWVHGDVTGSNLLVQDGRLSAVIDFGCSAIGDPACDTTVAWTFFDGESRAAFKAGMSLDDATWARGRGWALWKALLQLVAGVSNRAGTDRSTTRMGWRFSPRQVIAAVIADHWQ